jgi:hypothetical protein
MKGIFKRAFVLLSLSALFCIHASANAEETKADSTAQSGVAAQDSKQSQDAAAKSAKTDDAKKQGSTEDEPECSN